MLFKSYKHFHKLQMYARMDSHRDNSTHLRVVEFFFSLCSSSKRNQYTFVTIKTQTNKQTNKQKNINNKKYITKIINSISSDTFLDHRSTAFFSLSDETCKYFY